MFGSYWKVGFSVLLKINQHVCKKQIQSFLFERAIKTQRNFCWKYCKVLFEVIKIISHYTMIFLGTKFYVTVCPCWLNVMGRNWPTVESTQTGDDKMSLWTTIMTSWNGKDFCITGPLWRESTTDHYPLQRVIIHQRFPSQRTSVVEL